MIKWADMKFGPLNLWSAPNQELQMLEIDRYIAANARGNEFRYPELAADFRSFAEEVDRAIREREFIYFCRSGRFPD